MKLERLYPIVLLTVFTAFVLFGDLIFQPQAIDDSIPHEPEYTYLSPYVGISHYDRYFREAADSIGYDWTLIAAIAFTESRFDSTAVSEVGACGVMQVMPRTLRGLGVADSLHSDSRTNIMAAARLLRSLEKQYRYIGDSDERINFVLASYNAGYGHILDAMRLARKYGKDRHVWNSSVDTFLVLKSQPEYYTDTLCRNGMFKDWKQTLSFVKKVRRHWKRFSGMQERYSDSINKIVETDTLKRIMQ